MNIPASITILQCNIGGNPVSRLAHGETLEKHIRQHNPTVIALTETKRTRKDIPKISGYSLITHDPLRGSSGGIAIYFKDSLKFRFSTAFSSTKHSIIWTHLQHHHTSSNDLYLCVVYAPQASAASDKKSLFWEELDVSTTQFQEKPGHRIILGDFNTRLGSITGDHASNSNKKAFTDYMTDHTLINLNVIKTLGQYTFHNINTGDRSIIDYLLTDMSVSKIQKHQVLNGALGTSSQTAHKALLSKVLI